MAKRLVILAVAVALLLLFLWPPFMCTDAETGGRVHRAIGHYPVWNPPSAETAYYMLYPNTREIPDAQRLNSLTLRVNRVRLMTYAFAIGFACAMARLALRWKSHRPLIWTRE